MIKIALMGEIASGKTFVGKCFRYPIFNADDEVKKIYKNNKQCFKKLNNKFPKNIINFPINKIQLRNVLNKKNIKILSKIVHPYVRKVLKKFLKKNKSKKYVILDIPLLVENKLHNKSDILIYVKSTKKIINKRLKKRKNFNKKLLTILKSQQLDLNKKIKLSHYIINNSSDKKNTLKQVIKIKKEIK
jgi:dephospho-CoA kinase